MRFLRHQSDVMGRTGSVPQAHRLDELHRVIPWQVARQQSPTPLHPVDSSKKAILVFNNATTIIF